MVSIEPCLVKLQVFEGPLDLLLYLIKKNEVNIYDIPIAMITEQYLEYLGMMRELNLEVVGDYLMIAAELGFIKSKMLLPQPEPDEEEKGDPRAELVMRLIEYQRYKGAAQELLKLEILERDIFIRIGQDEEEEEEQKNQSLRVDLWSLIDAFREVYKRRDYSWTDNVQFDLDTLTLDAKIDEVVAKIRKHRRLLFQDLFRENSSGSGVVIREGGFQGASRFDVVVTFLAVLELMRTAVISAFQDLPYDSIQLVYLGEN